MIAFTKEFESWKSDLKFGFSLKHEGVTNNSSLWKGFKYGKKIAINVLKAKENKK